MKRLAILAVAAVGLWAAAASAEAPVGQAGVALPGGVYNSLRSADAAACARLCSDDQLCMAWTQTPANACELKAVVPHAIAQSGATSGLSPRAADFLRRLSEVAPAAAPPPQQHAEASLAHRGHDEAASALLGGLEDDGLRPTFGSN